MSDAALLSLSSPEPCPHPEFYTRDMFNQPQAWGSCPLCTIESLRDLVYVPGLWRCPKCDFRLMRTTLNVATGTASADDTTGEKCPNCQSPLWRVTERDAGNDLAKRCEALQLRVNELEAIPTVVESESGNPGWVDAKDAVRMLIELRRDVARYENGRIVLSNEIGRLKAELAESRGEVDRLNGLINTPHTDEFFDAVRYEMPHQRERWGSDHDGGKTPADWFWLIGYLAGKALHAIVTGNIEKTKHHIVTTAAALGNWFLRVSGESTTMRPGIEPPTGEPGVDEMLAGDRRLYGSSYMRIDADGTRTRIDPATVMIAPQPTTCRADANGICDWIACPRASSDQPCPRASA